MSSTIFLSGNVPQKILAFLSLVFLLSCKKAGGDEQSPANASTPKANVIQGTVYDAHNHKFNVPGAEVIIHIYGNSTSIGQSSPLYNVKMDASGHYEVQVANNVYAVHARAYVQLGGKTAAIELKPLDGKGDNIGLPSAPGIVRDFALQLTGEIPGGDPSTIQGYYGAKVWVGDGAYNFTSTGFWSNLAAKYPGAKVQLLFTPISPLIDGTTGENVVKEATVDDVKTGKWFVGIPYAVYRVYARLVASNGQTANLRVSSLPNTNSAASVDLSFPPDPSDPFQYPRKEQLAVWE
jgi:hypothetical protein